MVDENAVATTRTRIKTELCLLGRALERGDENMPLTWVIPGLLAAAHRPLRYHQRFGGRARQLPPEAAPEVFRWIDRIVREGIRSTICLMHPKEIQHYAALELGAFDLLAFYQKNGLMLCHLPWDDPNHHSPEGRVSFQDEVLRIRDAALSCFDQLPKPVLIHCSAGQDRSAPVAAYIHEMRGSTLR